MNFFEIKRIFSILVLYNEQKSLYNIVSEVLQSNKKLKIYKKKTDRRTARLKIRSTVF